MCISRALVVFREASPSRIRALGRVCALGWCLEEDGVAEGGRKKRGKITVERREGNV